MCFIKTTNVKKYFSKLWADERFKGRKGLLKELQEILQEI